jgi:hypothetical protein
MWLAKKELRTTGIPNIACNVENRPNDPKVIELVLSFCEKTI